uniref:Uncharacterized protein n=1 Tax=Arundo donax TaxID=35708 RepID=A0A0A9C9M6_ARUDO
MTKKKSPNF